MSRLEKRVAQLEGGVSEGTDIIAKVPHAWPADRQSAEVRAIALSHGATEPFGMVILIQRFVASDDEGAKITFMGRFGVDSNLPQPLTRRRQ